MLHLIAAIFRLLMPGNQSEVELREKNWREKFSKIILPAERSGAFFWQQASIGSRWGDLDAGRVEVPIKAIKAAKEAATSPTLK